MTMSDLCDATDVVSEEARDEEILENLENLENYCIHISKEVFKFVLLIVVGIILLLRMKADEAEAATGWQIFQSISIFAIV